jgi:murein DD-endopeptidase MepM/ murein hydrolase activator NlpD
LFGPRSSLAAPRRALLPGVLVAIVALVASGLVASASPAATVESERARIAQIQEQIAEKGAEIEALVGKANQARANLDSVRAEIRHDEQLLADDARAERAAEALVRQAAVVAYVGHAGDGGSGLALLDGTSSITQIMGGRHYLNSVNSQLDDRITKLELAKGRTDDDRRLFVKQQDEAQHVLDQLTRAQAEAGAAISAENETLRHATAELTSMLIAQNRQKEARARAAAQRAIAAALAAATAKEDAAPNAPQPVMASEPAPSIVLPVPTRVSSHGYANPFRSVGGLTPERIDEGVDYAGVGPVYAVGNGVVLSTYGSGWPGGTFIAYQLSDGPARGLVVYVAEDLNPQVSVGSAVTANTVIGQMYGGPHGIETGWADGSAIPNAMARSYGQYHGGNSTAFGDNYSRFLQSVGAPSGILQNDPTGTLPSGWPQW